MLSTKKIQLGREYWRWENQGCFASSFVEKLYQIQYKNTTELHGGYILIPWCELTEQSKVAESARCSSFFSFFPDRGPCNDCL